MSNSLLANSFCLINDSFDVEYFFFFSLKPSPTFSHCLRMRMFEWLLKQGCWRTGCNWRLCSSLHRAKKTKTYFSFFLSLAIIFFPLFLSLSFYETFFFFLHNSLVAYSLAFAFISMSDYRIVLEEWSQGNKNN